MKKYISALIAILMIFTFSACGFDNIEPRKIVEKFDKVTEFISKSQITKDKDLFGKREYSDDKYVGSYESICDEADGRDVIFGGASVKERKIKVYGNIKTDKGSAKVRIRLGEKVNLLEIDENGNFCKELDFDGGGNYIMIDYKNFSGSISLTSEYVK